MGLRCGLCCGGGDSLASGCGLKLWEYFVESGVTLVGGKVVYIVDYFLYTWI